MSIKYLEQEIFDLEGVRVFIRVNSRPLEVPSYNYQRRASESTTIGEFIRTRITPLFNSKTEVVVVNGYGDIPNIRTHLQTVRDTYRT